MSYQFIDLFCGAGGFSKGLELAGLECIGGIELKEVIAKTHQLNHKKSKTIFGDIREISPEKFAEVIGTKHVDVIIGGPPCPTFSTIGHAKIRSVTGKPVSEDPRNQLFLEYLRYVDYFRPEIFVIENVPNFITKYKGKIFNTAVEIIENIGKDDEGNGEGIYEVVKPVQVVNAVYYGVPQTRRRMMLVAHKKSNKVLFVTSKYSIPETIDSINKMLKLELDEIGKTIKEFPDYAELYQDIMMIRSLNLITIDNNEYKSNIDLLEKFISKYGDSIVT